MTGDVTEYVRFAAIEAFLVLAKSGQMARDQVVAYYGALFHGKLARTPSHAWNGLACAVAELPAPELLDEVRRAYADGLTEPGFAGLAGIERDLLDPDQSHRRRRAKHGVIIDAIAEMDGWHAFQKETPPKKLARPISPPPPIPSLSTVPVHRVKVGRNDPCPCASRRKWKNCCGNN